MSKGKKKEKPMREKPVREEAQGALADLGGYSAKELEGELFPIIVQDLADFFKVFGDCTRIRLLRLMSDGELSVGEIAAGLDMTQSAVSHQLRVLRQSQLVKYRKEGKTVIYSLDDEHVRTILEQGMNHIRHKKGY